MSKQNVILVIDDDPTFLQIAKVALEQHGYCVETARDSEEGLLRMQGQQPNLVILDVMMNWVLEGVSLSRQMMDQSELSRIPIIMCTSIRSSECKGYFPQDEYLHIDQWLDKPCPPDRLVAEVQAILARHERHAQGNV